MMIQQETSLPSPLIQQRAKHNQASIPHFDFFILSANNGFLTKKQNPAGSTTTSGNLHLPYPTPA